MNTQVFVQWNCRGLRANFDEIQILIQNLQPIVFCLQETKISANSTISLRQYTHFLKTQNTNDTHPQGGVSIFVKKNIPHSQIKLDTPLQAVAATVSCHRPITVCSIYIPPHLHFSDGDLDHLLLQLPRPVLIMGDFNAHSPVWGDDKLDARGRSMELFLTNNNLCVLNSKNSHTYIHPASGSRTAIDLTVCDPQLFLDFMWRRHDDQCGSDHFPLIVESNKALPASLTTRWKLDKADWSEFQRLCTEVLNPTVILQSPDPVEAFTTSVVDVASRTIPRTHPSQKRISKPWFNVSCKIAINARKAALRRLEKQPVDVNLQAYRILRAKARQTIRTNKKTSWQSYVSQLNDKTPSKKVWDMVRKISGKSVSGAIKHLNKNGNLITDIQGITNVLADTFEYNSSTQHYTPTFQREKSARERHKINFTSTGLEDYNSSFSMKELRDSLAASHNTTPGSDNIPYELLKHLPQPAIELLLAIFNLIWESGNFPSSWRQAIIVPLPKPGKDDSNPNNYRPIALTSCVCKTMERMVNARLVFYLEQNGILTEYQSGFRKQRSTTEQLIRLDSWVREGLASGQHVVAVFFDLEKAYDTTWKYGILSDLYKAGLRGHMPVFISKFLEGREFRVRIGSTLSDIHQQEMGVPQGSVLSVTLFSLKINGIVTCLTAGVGCSLYVDDFLACCKSRQMRSVERQLQQCLNNLQTWADQNGFKFSQSKTVCIHFCHKRKLHPDHSLTFNNVPIPIVTETKFLGLFFITNYPTSLT